MANPHKGEVSLQVGEKSYTLHLSVNALCELEDALGKPAQAVFAELNKDGKVKTIRTIVWAALTDNHPEITPKDAGKIINEVGMKEIMAKLEAALVATFPPAEAKSDEARPS